MVAQFEELPFDPNREVFSLPLPPSFLSGEEGICLCFQTLPSSRTGRAPRFFFLLPAFGTSCGGLFKPDVSLSQAGKEWASAFSFYTLHALSRVHPFFCPRQLIMHFLSCVPPRFPLSFGSDCHCWFSKNILASVHPPHVLLSPQSTTFATLSLACSKLSFPPR